MGSRIMREFSTGATRDSDLDKPDFEGYFSPYALDSYGAYMLKHQKQADGSMRASDNWKKGIPQTAYRKSLYRHHLEFQKAAAEGRTTDAIEMANAILFNVMGWLHEELKPAQQGQQFAGAVLGAGSLHDNTPPVPSEVGIRLAEIHADDNPMTYRP